MYKLRITHIFRSQLNYLFCFKWNNPKRKAS